MLAEPVEDPATLDSRDVDVLRENEYRNATVRQELQSVIEDLEEGLSTLGFPGDRA